jgi:hypothetical protein
LPDRRVDIAMAEAFSLDPETAHPNHGAFSLDPETAHLNHGAFGVAPVAVRRAVFHRDQRRNDQELAWEDSHRRVTPGRREPLADVTALPCGRLGDIP